MIPDCQTKGLYQAIKVLLLMFRFYFHKKPLVHMPRCQLKCYLLVQVVVPFEHLLFIHSLVPEGSVVPLSAPLTITLPRPPFYSQFIPALTRGSDHSSSVGQYRRSLRYRGDHRHRHNTTEGLWDQRTTLDKVHSYLCKLTPASQPGKKVHYRVILTDGSLSRIPRMTTLRA